MLDNLRPLYGRPSADRLAFATSALLEVEQYIAPGSIVFSTVLVRALLLRRCTTAEGMWAIYEQIVAGRYPAAMWGEQPAGRGFVVSEGTTPAGLELAEGTLHVDGRKTDWGMLVITLPYPPETPSGSIATAELETEGELIERQARSVLESAGIDAGKTAALTSAQKMYLVWLGLKTSGMTGAPIRDEWNRNFPGHAIQATRGGATHVRTGIREAKRLILRLTQ